MQIIARARATAHSCSTEAVESENTTAIK